MMQGCDDARLCSRSESKAPRSKIDPNNRRYVASKFSLRRQASCMATFYRRKHIGKEILEHSESDMCVGRRNCGVVYVYVVSEA